MFRPHCGHLQANAHWRHLICICWPEDGRNAVETRSQKLLNVLALTIACFVILLLCLTWNIYTCSELLALRPSPKPKDYPLSAVRDCLFNIFAATIHPCTYECNVNSINYVKAVNTWNVQHQCILIEYKSTGIPVTRNHRINMYGSWVKYVQIPYGTSNFTTQMDIHML